MAIHDFGIARNIVDKDIATVYATGSCLVDTAIAELGDVGTIT
jgi:myo-inositol 2-dehydrogenase/D-chiro-inositol 1-dehydrogenase